MTDLNGFTRRRMLASAAGAALAGAAFSGAAPMALAATAARPDMILVMTDDPDFRWTLRYMPHTTKLIARRGVEFANSFTDFSLCSPSRASFHTGLSSVHHGIFNDDPVSGWDQLDPLMDNSLMTWAKDAGYRVGFFGKMQNGYQEDSRVLPGVDVCAVECSSTSPFRYYGPKTKDQNGVVTQHKKDVYFTTLISQLACDFIATTPAEQPLLLIVCALAPHGGHGEDGAPTPEEKYLHTYDDVDMPELPDFNEADVSDKPLGTVGALPLVDVEEMVFEWRMRRAALRSVDDMNLAILQQLKASGRAKRAHFAFTGDNGWSQGEHRQRGKIFVYEETNRVPLVWSGPGIPTTGQVRMELINNLDLPATMVDLMGLTPGRTLDGASLRGMLEGGAPDWRQHILLRDRFTWAVRTADGWLYAETTTDEYGEEFELYDLAGSIATTPDPYENRNVAGKAAFAAKQAELKALLDSLRPS